MDCAGESEGYSVTHALWAADREELLSVREAVFILEQGVAREIEVDGADKDCLHVIARDALGNPIGTGRLDRGGHIGRVAVLRHWRRRGVGRRLMEVLVARAIADGYPRVELNSQIRANEFYIGLGFFPVGEEFVEAGIRHVTMIKNLRGKD